MSSERSDVVVVGGGVVGLSLAYQLTRSGASVVLVDRHDVGRATDAGAGILSPETAAPTDPNWLGLAMRAGAHYRDLVPELIEETGEDGGFSECGYLLVATREGEDDLFELSAKLFFHRSPHAIREVRRDEAADMFPPLAPVRRAIFNRSAARVDGRSLAVALRLAGQKLGLRVVHGAAHTLVVKGHLVTGLKLGSDATPSDTISFGALAIAGGAWSREFESQLGVAIPVVPVKGQIVHLSLPGQNTRDWPIVQPVLSHYLVPWPQGRVACGGTFEEGAGFDHAPTAAGLKQLLRECLIVAPGMANATFLEVRVGLRPVVADDVPVLGKLPGWENVHVATGHGANGLLLGPYSAKLVAGEMLGEPLPLDLAPFSIARFA